MNLKYLFKQIVIYSFGVFSLQIINFISTKIYTSYFTIDEFGQITLILAAVGLISSTISGSQISSGFGRYFSDKKNISQKKIIFSTSLYTILIISFGSFLFTLFFINFFKINVFENNFQVILIILFLLFSFFTTIDRFLKLFFKWNHQPIRYIIFTNFSLFLSLIFVLFFAFYLNQRLNGFIIGLLISTIISIIIIIPFIIGNIKKIFSKEWSKKILKYSLPLIPYTGGILILTYTDRFFIKYFYNFEYAGIYSIGAKIATILSAVLTGFRNSWGPYFHSTIYDKNSKQNYAKVFDVFMFVGTFLIIGIILFSKELILLISTKEYLSTKFTIPLLLISSLIFNLQYFLLGIYIKNKTYFLTISASIAIILNIILDIILIPKFNIIGAALATMISFVLMFIINMNISQKLFLIPYKFKKNFLLLILFYLVSIALLYNEIKIYNNIVIKLLILLLIYISYNLFGIFNIKDLKKLKSKNNQ